jgi:putative ABC transport system permease protein
MTTADILHETFSALTANKVRTALTMLGIVIGISSVIILVAIGQGAQSQIQSSIQSIGSNLIIIYPGAQRSFGYGASGGRGNATTLTPADADAIAANVQNISSVAPELDGRYQITAPGTNTNTQVIGTVPDYATVRNVMIAEGAFFDQGQVSNRSKVAIIGPTTASDLFPNETGAGQSVVGQIIRIKGQQFTVIGVTKSKGSSGGPGNQDDIVYVPMSAAALFLSGNTTSVSTISVSAASPDVMTQVQNDITSLLLERHKISEAANADFNVLNQADIVATASAVTGTFTLFLGAVAGISLLVGGIGIMNMMLTTVTERTREIGLRKAIGAKGADISIQFLAEAVSLTVASGAIGVAIGWLAAYVVSSLGVLQTTISMSSILLAFGVSAAIGIVFGYYPARRAAKLNPIEALRYE